MLFNSIPFLIFLPIVTLIYYFLPHKFRWFFLLAASCYFYMYFIPKYILILLITIIVDYSAGIFIEKHNKDNDVGKKKFWFILSIVITCSVLFIFKYLNFINDNIIYLSNKIGFKYPQKALNIILPIGLSFHTFQSLSYVIEVYRGHQKAEHHFGYYALYVMFYPQLVTGPIERPQNLLRQLHEEQYFKADNIVLGLRLVLFGLFIKMVIADNVGAIVDIIYENPSSFNTASILTGIFLYSFQIYCDFFGYSTIALGCAKCLGYDITDNFKTPYISKSLTEFWRRWHISLSTWFRDYVYIPLGGNRVKNKWIFNTMVVFLLSGIWHGANWTFAIWGIFHGIILVIEKLFRKKNKNKNLEKSLENNIEQKESLSKKIGNAFKIVFTFIIVSLLWVIFRAINMGQVKEIFTSIFTNTNVTDTFKVPIRVWIFLIIFIIIDIVLRNTRFDRWLNNKNIIFRWFIYLFLIFSIVVFASVESYPFIYFQF